MRHIFLVPLFFIFPIHTFAFDATCFREHAEITVATTSDFTTTIPTSSEDIFFVQDGKEIKSGTIRAEKNPPIKYTLDQSLDNSVLQDLDRQTVIEIDPFLLKEYDYSIIADLGKIYERGTVTANIGYYSPSGTKISISKDGTNFIDVNENSISNFDFRYFRLIFRKSDIQSQITLFHTLIFLENKKMRFIAHPDFAGKVDIYRGSICSSNKPYQSYAGISGGNMDISQDILLNFAPNPLYKNDQDQDGIENLLDNCPSVANPDQADRNRDGLGDACSDDDNDSVYGASDNCPTIANSDQADKNINQIGDICEFDTDNDGVPDGIDNAIHIANPDQADLDSDNIGDIMDNCNLYNPDQLDLDKNMKGDVCDRDLEYRLKNDTDKDSILDFSDNCRYASNQDQGDTDTDGIGDVCDNCKMLQNPDQKDDNKNGIGDMCDDTDNDSVEGWRDNCPSIANPDQKDSNNDSIGDMCSDTDGDRVFDSLDNCPTSYNPKQENIDKDDMGDVCDTSDSRFLESNKYVFMGIVGLFALAFITMIVFLLMKLNKPKNTL